MATRISRQNCDDRTAAHSCRCFLPHSASLLVAKDRAAQVTLAGELNPFTN
jgi:hypothetical protein